MSLSLLHLKGQYALGIHLDDENDRFRSLDIQDQHPYIPFIDLMGYFFYDIPTQHYQVLD